MLKRTWQLTSCVSKLPKLYHHEGRLLSHTADFMHHGWGEASLNLFVVSCCVGYLFLYGCTFTNTRLVVVIKIFICVSDYYQILWQNIYSSSHTPPSNQNRVLICVSDYYQILWQNIYSTSHTPPSNTPTSTLSLPGEWSYSLVSGYAQAMLHCIANHLLDIIPSSHLYPLGC